MSPDLAAFFDLHGPAVPANKTMRRDERTVRCGRWRSGCTNQVDGIDPQRTCAACRDRGAPTRVPWDEAKDTTGTFLPELVLEPLKNAHLSEMAIHAPAPADPKAEVGSFEGAGGR